MSCISCMVTSCPARVAVNSWMANTSSGIAAAVSTSSPQRRMCREHRSLAPVRLAYWSDRLPRIHRVPPMGIQAKPGARMPRRLARV